MRIIAAPDSFKGSLSALEAAEAMRDGIKSVFAGAEVLMLPLADGGDGTVQAILSGGGEQRHTNVTGPLEHMRVEAEWALMPDGTAVLECAAASGLALLKGMTLNAGAATSFGTGELVLAALEAGARRIIVGIGGSAMTDGGTGLARALGARFIDASGQDIPLGGLTLGHLCHIDLTNLDPRLAETQITIAADVNSPLYGPLGAAHVFGPQKGADPQTVLALDAALEHYAKIASTITGREAHNIPGAGAAGGLGAGLLYFTNSSIQPGAELLLNTLGFERLLKGANLVITGEGQTDFQSARGKLPSAVTRAAKSKNVPVVCISGALGQGYQELYAMGLNAASGCPHGPSHLDECLANAATLLTEATERCCRLLSTGMLMQQREDKN